MPISAGNVLIVEDDPEVREMLTQLLTSEGFYAVGAEDGLEALHLLRMCGIGRRTRRAWCCSI